MKRIRNVRPRLDTLDLDVAGTVQHFDEAVPLPSGIRRRCADVARHPRVDVIRAASLMCSAKPLRNSPSVRAAVVANARRRIVDVHVAIDVYVAHDSWCRHGSRWNGD
jgi:hypothetical protein